MLRIDLRQVLLLATERLRSAVASRAGLIFAALVVASAIIAVDAIVSPIEVLEDWLGAGPPSAPADAGLLSAVAESQHLRALATWVTQGDPARSAYLLQERPAILSGILLVLLLWTPFLAALGSFDQTAGDVDSRWIRFVLIRCERSSVFGGRLLAAGAIVMAVYALLVASLVAYLDWRLGLYPTASLAGWGWQGYQALTAFALPHVALCAWVSAASRSSLRALGACLVAVALPIAILGVSAAQWEGAGAWVRLHPWGWKYQLLDPDPGARAAAFGAMLGFTAVFTIAGAATFQRRDL